MCAKLSGRRLRAHKALVKKGKNGETQTLKKEGLVIRAFRLFVILFLTAAAFPVWAQEAQGKYRLPDTLTFGGGWFEEVFEAASLRRDADFRLEHRWGLSLLSAADESLTSLDPYFQIRPFAGVETTMRQAFYGFGGVLFDILVGPHIVLTPSLAVGIYTQGNDKRLGSPLEFRSTAEAGWRFDNGFRLTAYVSHMSNAELTKVNPGAEMAGAYIHIPF